MITKVSILPLLSVFETYTHGSQNPPLTLPFSFLPFFLLFFEIWTLLLELPHQCSSVNHPTPPSSFESSPSQAQQQESSSSSNTRVVVVVRRGGDRYGRFGLSLRACITLPRFWEWLGCSPGKCKIFFLFIFSLIFCIFIEFRDPKEDLLLILLGF